MPIHILKYIVSVNTFFQKSFDPPPVCVIFPQAMNREELLILQAALDENPCADVVSVRARLRCQPDDVLAREFHALAESIEMSHAE